MSRGRWIALGLFALLTIASHVMAALEPDQTASLAALKTEGDIAYEERRWFDAANAWRGAFALEAPVADRNRYRAMLALQIGRALARESLRDERPRYSAFHARNARIWFGEAVRIHPRSTYTAWYDLGRLREDHPVPSQRDVMKADAAYQRFLDERPKDVDEATAARDQKIVEEIERRRALRNAQGDG